MLLLELTQVFGVDHVMMWKIRGLHDVPSVAQFVLDVDAHFFQLLVSSSVSSDGSGAEVIDGSLEFLNRSLFNFSLKFQ